VNDYDLAEAYCEGWLVMALADDEIDPYGF
jgi:hypothetical protein